MEKPRFKPRTPPPQTHQILSPSSGGRRSNASNSPEFEFWKVRNPSFPQPHLLSADELFVNGVLLPLHLLQNHSNPPDSELKSNKEQLCTEPEPGAGPAPESSTVSPESSTLLSASKRWRDIFKIGEKKIVATTSSSSKNPEDKEKDKGKDRDKNRDKEKKKERKSGGGSQGGTELNINLWPFSRSRSAGNSGNRPKLATGSAATRKVSSAPCSRSNSGGESKSKKWPSSPSRGGVHLGRSSPVWQVRRGGTGVRSFEPLVRNGDKGGRKEVLETRQSKNGGGGGAPARVLNLNAPICIGSRHHLGCKSDENSTAAAAGGGGGGGGGQSSGGGVSNGGSGGNYFNLRNFFSKKVY